MTREPRKTPPVVQLADRLEAHLKAKGLQAGDRFLTAREAARELKVRQELANRALQILVHRGRIERRQRVGAIVTAPPSSAPDLARIHILIQEDHLRAEAEEAAATQVGLLSQWPRSEIVIQVVPTGSATGYVADVLQHARRAKQPEGLVLVRCDYPTQKQVVESGLPAVLHGSAYPGIPLASVNVDEHQMGDLQAEAMLARGVRRIVALRKERSAPGDLEFLRGLKARMASAGLAADSVDLIDLPPDRELIGAALQPMLGDVRAGSRDIGLVCATRAFADAAWAAAIEGGLAPGVDFPVHANRAQSRSHSQPSYPYLRASVRPEQRGEWLGELLHCAFDGSTGVARHRLVACELVTPSPAR